MTAFDEGNQAALFVTNVLNGTVAANGNVVNRGTVIRLDLDVPTQGQGQSTRKSTTVIGSGFSQRTDPAALVIGPTGVGLSGETATHVHYVRLSVTTCQTPPTPSPVVWPEAVSPE
jgi:hypothetical protein